MTRPDCSVSRISIRVFHLESEKLHNINLFIFDRTSTTRLRRFVSVLEFDSSVTHVFKRFFISYSDTL